jgi:hypothetical protein
VAQQPVLARNTVLQILAGDGLTWVQLEGIQTLSVDPSTGEVVQDKTTYGNGGHDAGIKTQIGTSAEVGYLRLVDDITGARAPGQARVETLSQLTGSAGFAQVRLRELSDTFWSYWSETLVTAGASTGATNDLRSGSYTFRRNVLPQLVAV